MHAVEVQRNGQPLAVVEADSALMFSADISVSLEENAGTIDIRGMNDLGAERTSHTTWRELETLQTGDTLRFSFIQIEAPTPPAQEVASDSEEHLSGQKEYEEQLKSNPPTERALDARNPDATVHLIMETGQRFVATLEGGRQFISFQLLWDRWQPERCRISLRSFSQKEALERSGAKEWYQGALLLGQSCEVQVDA